MIESRNRFCNSKCVSICPWWWIKSLCGGAFGSESSQLWVVVWFRTPKREMSSEGSMALELWLRVVVKFRHGWDSGIETMRASPCSCHWTCVVILAGQILTIIQMPPPLSHLLDLADEK